MLIHFSSTSDAFAKYKPLPTRKQKLRSMSNIVVKSEKWKKIWLYATIKEYRTGTYFAHKWFQGMHFYQSSQLLPVRLGSPLLAPRIRFCQANTGRLSVRRHGLASWWRQLARLNQWPSQRTSIDRRFVKHPIFPSLYSFQNLVSIRRMQGFPPAPMCCTGWNNLPTSKSKTSKNI